MSSPVHSLRQAAARVGVLVAALLLAACASRPPARDGPEANPPSGLERTPDAEPRLEPLRRGGPNQPYEVLGVTYRPIGADAALRETGLASWYGRKFHGKPTSSGEPYDMYAMTAAHKTLPIPSYARVTNPANQREVIVRVNDRGPFASGRIIDLSYTAALRLGLLGGVAPVVVERITPDEIRAGLWKRERGGAAPVQALAPPPFVAAAPAIEPPPTAPGGDPLMALVAAAEGSAGVPGAGFWLQLGAFRQRDGASQLQQRVLREGETVAPGVLVSEDRDVFRVHAGPYASRAEALAMADRLKNLLALMPLLVERR